MSDPVAVDIGALEAGVLARLRDKVTGYAIDPYPDNPDTYKLLHQKGAFLVAYRGADYQPTEDTGDVVQQRDMMIDVVINCRQLSGNGNAYAMIEIARAVLLGWKIAGFTKLTLSRDRFVGFREGSWLYALTFKAATVAVELPDDLVLPTLSQLTAEGDFGTVEVPTAP